MTRYIKIFHESLLDHLVYSFAKDKFSATPRDKFNAVVISVRENLVEQWMLAKNILRLQRAENNPRSSFNFLSYPRQYLIHTLSYRLSRRPVHKTASEYVKVDMEHCLP